MSRFIALIAHLVVVAVSLEALLGYWIPPLQWLAHVWERDD